MISAACARVGERVLICSGPNDPAAVEHSDHVKVVEAVNHSAIFPACRAVVHHGGAGTTAAALRAGIPTLILWLWLDQPFWAAVVQQLKVGFGRRFSDTTVESLVADLRLMLSPQYSPGPRNRRPDDQTRRKPHQGRRFVRRSRSAGTVNSLRPHLAHRPGFDGVDRQRAAGKPPSGIGPLILVVVTKMPHHIGQLIAASSPVMRDAGNAPAGTVGLRADVVDLADDRVLGADSGRDGGDRGGDRRMTAVTMDSGQLTRRVGQHQLGCLNESPVTRSNCRSSTPAAYRAPSRREQRDRLGRASRRQRKALRTGRQLVLGLLEVGDRRHGQH